MNSFTYEITNEICMIKKTGPVRDYSSAYPQCVAVA